jgi:hypothetical protein
MGAPRNAGAAPALAAIAGRAGARDAAALAGAAAKSAPPSLTSKGTARRKAASTPVSVGRKMPRSRILPTLYAHSSQQFTAFKALL